MEEPTASSVVSFGFRPKALPRAVMNGERESDFDGDENEADAAEFQNVAEQKARPEQDDSGFEPEFVSGEAGFERRRERRWCWR